MGIIRIYDRGMICKNRELTKLGHWVDHSNKRRRYHNTSLFIRQYLSWQRGWNTVSTSGEKPRQALDCIKAGTTKDQDRQDRGGFVAMNASHDWIEIEHFVE